MTCCTCNLTKAVWLIIIVEACIGVLAGLVKNWVALAISTTVLLVLLGVLLCPRSIFMRGFALTLYVALTVLSTLETIIVTIYLGYVDGRLDKTFRDYCLQHTQLYPDRFSSLADCVDFVRSVSLTLLIVAAVCVVLLRICFCRLLYYGMRE